MQQAGSARASRVRTDAGSEALLHPCQDWLGSPGNSPPETPPMSSDHLLRAEAGGVVHLTLHRPEKRNALSRAMLAELGAALDALMLSRTRVVILGAVGPVFCSGHDLAEMVGRNEEEYHDLFSLCS